MKVPIIQLNPTFPSSKFRYKRSRRIETKFLILNRLLPRPRFRRRARDSLPTMASPAPPQGSPSWPCNREHHRPVSGQRDRPVQTAAHGEWFNIHHPGGDQEEVGRYSAPIHRSHLPTPMGGRWNLTSLRQILH